MGGGPELVLIDPSGIFWGAFFGFLLALPLGMFMSFWLSAVRKRAAVVIGALIGAVVGLLIILGWVDMLIFDTVLPGADPGATFFGSFMLCGILALVGGICTDLLVARLNKQDYRRSAAAHH